MYRPEGYALPIDFDKVKQLTQKEAIAFAQGGTWKSWSDELIASFQLSQDKLCVPFDRFHEAIEKVLKRPVYTHEFADPDKLRLEFNGVRKAPTIHEILALLPKDKTIMVLTGRQKS